MSDFSYRLSATDRNGDPVDIQITLLPGFGFDAGGWYDLGADGTKTYRSSTRVAGTLEGRLFPWAVDLLCPGPKRSAFSSAYRQRQRNRAKRRRR